MAMLRPARRLHVLSANPSKMVSRVMVPSSSLFLPRPPSLQTIRVVTIRPFTSSNPPDPDRLSWDEFLRLRRQRRLTGVIASFPTSLLGIYGGLQYFGTGEIDPTQTILGFDPFLMNAAYVIGCGLLGWLAGPTIGRGVWHIFHGKQAKLIAQREAQFFKHIEKNRADPSFQSYSNPVPDYYGEKIGSLKDYRRWLKDQKAYKKKAQNFL